MGDQFQSAEAAQNPPKYRLVGGDVLTIISHGAFPILSGPMGALRRVLTCSKHVATMRCRWTASPHWTGGIQKNFNLLLVHLATKCVKTHESPGQKGRPDGFPAWQTVLENQPRTVVRTALLNLLNGSWQWARWAVSIILNEIIAKGNWARWARYKLFPSTGSIDSIIALTMGSGLSWYSGLSCAGRASARPVATLGHTSWTDYVNSARMSKSYIWRLLYRQGSPAKSESKAGFNRSLTQPPTIQSTILQCRMQTSNWIKHPQSQRF